MPTARFEERGGRTRLVRVSPFDAAGCRHTSLQPLEVMPEMELDNTVEIPRGYQMEVSPGQRRGWPEGQ